MSGTGTPSTPSPYRTGEPNRQTHSRSQFEQELWDDIANVIYLAENAAPQTVAGGGSLIVCSLDIPCPVKCRLDIIAQSTAFLNAGTPPTFEWGAYVRVDGIDTIDMGFARQATNTGFPVTWFGAVDVDPGTRVVDIILYPDTTMDFYYKRLKVRRGRTPPS